VSTAWQIGGVADFDDDGQQDLLWQSPSTNSLPVIWYLNGRTYRDWYTVICLFDNVSSVFSIVGVADFNNDSQNDILWRNNQNGLPVLWYLNGKTFVTWSALSNLPCSSLDTAWKVGGVADVNDDGHVDIMWRNKSTSSLPVFWLMNGQTYQTWERAECPWIKVNSVFDAEAMADFNSDGHPDILWRSSVNGLPIVWYMNGKTYVSWTLIENIGSSVSTLFSIDGAADFGAP